MKFTRLETTHLSNGSLLELTQAGRKYRVLVGSPILGEAPIISDLVDKKRAYAMYNDMLREDVLDNN